MSMCIYKGFISFINILLLLPLFKTNLGSFHLIFTFFLYVIWRSFAVIDFFLFFYHNYFFQGTQEHVPRTRLWDLHVPPGDNDFRSCKYTFNFLQTHSCKLNSSWEEQLNVLFSSIFYAIIFIIKETYPIMKGVRFLYTCIVT